jgi:phosphate starvation-inducible PhoH-like protein
VEIAPLSMMRGRTFKHAWIVADEMQNATPAQAKMLMTRIGTGSKIIITGDVEQTDIKQGNNSLVDLCNRLENKGNIKGLTVCRFEARDIQRHPIIGSILKLYGD